MEYKIKDGKLIIDIESLMYSEEYRNDKNISKQDKIDLLNEKIKQEKELKEENVEVKKEDGSQLLKDVLNTGFFRELSKRIDIAGKEKNTKEEKDFGFINPKTNERFNTGQLLITMSTEKQEDFGQISDIDNDIYGYDRIRIFDIMGRKADKVHLINDGPDTMYALLNRSGIDDDKGIWTHQTEEELYRNWSTQDNLKASWSVNEVMIYPGEKWTFFDIYEMRVRSPTQGNRYRVTEDDVVGNTIRQVM